MLSSDADLTPKPMQQPAANISNEAGSWLALMGLSRRGSDADAVPAFDANPDAAAAYTADVPASAAATATPGKRHEQAAGAAASCADSTPAADKASPTPAAPSTNSAAAPSEGVEEPDTPSLASRSTAAASSSSDSGRWSGSGDGAAAPAPLLAAGRACSAPLPFAPLKPAARCGSAPATAAPTSSAPAPSGGVETQTSISHLLLTSLLSTADELPSFADAATQAEPCPRGAALVSFALTMQHLLDSAPRAF
jgi:hypothetical protein